MIDATLKQLDDFLEAFEAARRKADVPVADFVPPRGHESYATIVAELIRVDMEYSWGEGRRRLALEYQDRFPELFREAAWRALLAYEEYRLRRAAGESVPREEFARRYDVVVASWPEFPVGPVKQLPRGDDPLWTHWSLRNPREVRRIEQALVQMPEVGDRFLDFDLVSELGVGAFGKVFLAQQGELAHRLVALKITAQQTLEPQRLARLQHSNIVPLYSVHARGGLQAICMPFLGPNTLADIFRSVHAGPSSSWSGEAVASTIAARQASTLKRLDSNAVVGEDASGSVTESSGWKRLRKLNYSDAAAWIAARVAQGLAHAHAHGIVHRDLKPGNILLSDDGEPLILDFNLSLSESESGATVAGGTLPYMSPEQVEAFATGARVDARSDIFSLGVILYQMLTGRLPFSEVSGPLDEILPQLIERRRVAVVSPRALNAEVSSGLASIVCKCLAADPNQRYQDAAELADDLQRHLDHCRLAHARGETIGERSWKWMRRHPKLSSATTVAGCSLVLIAVFVAAAWSASAQLARRAALETLAQSESEAARLRAELCVPGRELTAIEASIANIAESLQACGLQQTQTELAQASLPRLTEPERNRLRRNVRSLAFLLASALTQRAQRETEPERRRATLDDALAWNERLRNDSRNSPSRLVARQRARILQEAGDKDAAADVLTAAEGMLGNDEFDEALRAFEQLARGDVAAAQPLTRSLVQRRPNDWTAWFYAATGDFYLGSWIEAESGYTACIALRPDNYLTWYQRGLCRLERRQFAAAASDFDVVIRLRPDLSGAWVNRAVAIAGAGDKSRACEDLTHALELPGTPTRAYFLRARYRQASGDAAGAARDVAAGLRREPQDELSWISRGVARVAQDPAGALDDFQVALRINAHSRAALQNAAHVLSERLGKNDEALALLERLVDASPDDVHAVVSRGVLRARLGRRADALSDARQAIERDHAALTAYQVGCIFALLTPPQEDDRTRAVALIVESLRKDPFLVRVALSDPDIASVRGAARLRSALSAAAALVENTPPVGDKKAD